MLLGEDGRNHVTTLTQLICSSDCLHYQKSIIKEFGQVVVGTVSKAGELIS